MIIQWQKFILDKKDFFFKLSISLLIISPLLLLAAFSYIRIYRQNTESVLLNKKLMAVLVSTVVKERLDKLVAVGVSLASRPRMIECLYERKYPEAIRVVEDIVRQFPEIDAVFLSDVNGVLLSGIPGFSDIAGNNFSYRDWYQGVSEKWQPYVSEVYSRANAPVCDIVAVAIPVKASNYVGNFDLDRDNNQDILGILVIQVPVENFAGWTRDVSIGDNVVIYLLDQKGQLVYNPGYTDIFRDIDSRGLLPADKELGGQEPRRMVYDPLWKKKLVSVSASVDKYGWRAVLEQPYTNAFSVRNAGLRYILIFYAVIFFLAIISLGVILYNISLRRKAEELLKKKNEELCAGVINLESSNKELDAFSYSVAHDLCSPLRAIDSFSKILIDEYSGVLDEEAHRLLNVICENAKRMDDLIKDLLAFSHLRRQEIKSLSFDLEEMVREVFSEIRDTVPERKIQISIAKLNKVEADPNMMRQVVYNLLSNAIKFTRPRLTAVIEWGVESSATENIYHIKDNGVGFDMQYRNKLFEVFQRLHPMADFEGTGIGLSIVKRVIARHGGRVWAESKPNEGATFYFTLPKKEEGK